MSFNKTKKRQQGAVNVIFMLFKARKKCSRNTVLNTVFSIVHVFAVIHHYLYLLLCCFCSFMIFFSLPFQFFSLILCRLNRENYDILIRYIVSRICFMCSGCSRNSFVFFSFRFFSDRFCFLKMLVLFCFCIHPIFTRMCSTLRINNNKQKTNKKRKLIERNNIQMLKREQKM